MIAVVGQVRFAMIWRIRVVNVILGCLVFNVDHFVQHTALGCIADNVLPQSLDSTVALSPELLVSAGPRAYPQAIFQTEETIHNILHRLRFSVFHTVNYPSTSRLNSLRMWLQKCCRWPKQTEQSIYMYTVSNNQIPVTNNSNNPGFTSTNFSQGCILLTKTGFFVSLRRFKLAKTWYKPTGPRKCSNFHSISRLTCIHAKCVPSYNISTAKFTTNNSTATLLQNYCEQIAQNQKKCFVLLWFCIKCLNNYHNI